MRRDVSTTDGAGVDKQRDLRMGFDAKATATTLEAIPVRARPPCIPITSIICATMG